MVGGRGSAWHNGSGIRRSEIVLRAESWLVPPVPHHRNRFHHNEYGIYRTDAPGYVSMAWAVLGVPPIRHGGLDIAGLAAVSDRIPAPELRAGDALLRTESPAHVALFHEWVDASRLSCWAFEHARGTGTVHRTIDFPHDDAARSFLPRRYRLLTD
ncbi:hypothetical protein [Actinophytocola sp.]|uniref:hypothetical protein n=1 Tax=Actinophytocola sp. TaxID=1872138 RepID=UPI002D4EA3DD|nr:hypothetical protein [Actinophytocola sp.]HYQ67985.1 hypothetical protein [Actinophytocola sp.]